MFNFIVMATTQQKLLNRWMEINYPELVKLMPLIDMLHSAYITVYETKRPIVPTHERFLSLMEDAYHRHFLSEFNHQMHFSLPDPVFWMFVDEDEQYSSSFEEEQREPSRSLNDLSAYSLKQLFAFVKRNFSARDFDIFQMAVVRRMTYKDIADAKGIGRAEVRDVIDRIESAIRRCRRPSKEKQNR